MCLWTPAFRDSLVRIEVINQLCLFKPLNQTYAALITHPKTVSHKNWLCVFNKICSMINQVFVPKHNK